ncbi:hypothetical protein [Bradyrhizobium sp. SRS-191]|uniref:hypothetical protein n=1 Tax=Bradyrhizobium sp. SRS-191 TaxID=2962606 RepID=UPI00211E7FA5|nr:hypothetical protein [Bradyrhizobium sp. SRS-191]
MAEVESQVGNFFDRVIGMTGGGLVDDTNHKSLIVLPADGSSITATLDSLANLRSGFAVSFHNPKASTRFHKIVTDSDTIQIPPYHTLTVFRQGTSGLMVSDQVRRHRAQGLTMYMHSAAFSDGSDGLLLSDPKKTVAAAVDDIYRKFDLQNAPMTLQPAGTSNESVGLQGQLTGFNYLNIQAAVLGNFTWGAGANGYCLLVQDNAEVICKYLKFTRGAQTNAILTATHQTAVADFDTCDFGDAGSGGTHCSMDHGGGSMNFGAYSISGPAATHLQVGGNCSVTQAGSVTITITGTPSIGTWYSIIGSGANVAMGSGVSFSGSVASGCTKYLVALNGSLSLGGNTLPGSVAGSATAGGQVAP